MDLVPHLVVIGLQKTSGPYLGIWRQNEFRFFAAGTEGLIPDTETLSISIPPFAERWIAESSKAIGLPTSQTRTHARTTLAKNKTYQPTLARTKDILAETQKLGPKLIDCIQHP